MRAEYFMLYLALAVFLGSTVYNFVRRRLGGNPPVGAEPAVVGGGEGGRDAPAEDGDGRAASGPVAGDGAGTGGNSTSGIRKRRQHVPVAYDDGPREGSSLKTA
jgi:hypothetical protein